MSADCTLQVFAKAPIAGCVKTRLSPALTFEQAAQLHQALLDRTLRVAVEADLGRIELWCSPNASHPCFKESATRFDISLREQYGDDLGARMHNALRSALAGGRPAILIGADCPELDAPYLRAAAHALASNDAAFGPVEDGGYILVGLTHDIDCFTGMRWSTQEVMADTRTRLRALKARWFELPKLWDLDTPDDLARLRKLPGWDAQFAHIALDNPRP